LFARFGKCRGGLGAGIFFLSALSASFVCSFFLRLSLACRMCENFLVSMTTPLRRSLALRKALFALVLALIAISIVFAALQNREWVIPEEAKKLKNPIAPSTAAIESARSIYLDKCSQCHGDAGKGDGPQGKMYDPAPGNLTDAKHMSKLTDGELFYQISEGRKPMPAFKKRLSEEQRWHLVLFVRSFAALAAAPEVQSGTPASKPSPADTH
jgi:mono/diheme cytochrome c family protein